MYDQVFLEYVCGTAKYVCIFRMRKYVTLCVSCQWAHVMRASRRLCV